MKQVFWTLITLLSHWRRRPANFVALFVGLAIATALWSGVQALNESARRSYDRAAAIFVGGGARSLVPAFGGAIPQDLFIKLRLAGWKVSPVLEGAILIHGRPFQLMGVEPLTLPRGLQFSGLAGGKDLSAFLKPPGQAFATPETLRDLGAAEGVAISTDSGKMLPPLKSSASAPPGILLVDIGVAQALLGRSGQLSRLILQQQPDGETPPLSSVAGDRLRLLPPGEEASDMRRLTDSFHLNLTAFGMLAYLVGLFIVYAASGLAFEQRRGMVRTMRSVGVSMRALVIAMVSELILLALVAGSAGVAAGSWLASALLPNVAASLDALYGARMTGQLALDGTWLLSGLGIALSGALVAAAGGLFKTFRMPILVAAQPFAWRQAQQKSTRLRAVFALLALAASLAAYLFGNGLASGFAVIAGLLLGAALLLPILLAGALQLAEKTAAGPLAQWFWADSRQQLPGLSPALTALLLALATNVGVGSMVEGFRETFTHWLDERLAAEVYFEAAGPAAALDIEAWLAKRPEVAAILPAPKTTIRLAGWPTEVVGMKADETYRSHFPLLSKSAGAWETMQRGEGALVSEQLARRLGLALGSTLDIPTANEKGWRTEVVGIFSDYGNPKGQLRIDVNALADHWPDTPRVTYGLRVAPKAVPLVIAAMQSQFGSQIVRITDQAAVKTLSMRIFEHTFAVTKALNTLTLIVSAVALLASLSTLADTRLAQMAPVWAAGVPRSRLAQLELLRLLLLAAATAIIALPLGLALAWCLVAVVNVQAFGWRLPFAIFPGQWAEVLALALLTAAVAAIAPIIRFNRTTPAELARVFSNER